MELLQELFSLTVSLSLFKVARYYLFVWGATVLKSNFGATAEYPASLATRRSRLRVYAATPS